MPKIQYTKPKPKKKKSVHRGKNQKYIPSDIFFKMKIWAKLKKKVYARYGYKCMKCGASNCELHIDHIKSRYKYPNLQFKLNNLQVLCRDCNIKKGYKNKTDYRPHSKIYLQNSTKDHWDSLRK